VTARGRLGIGVLLATLASAASYVGYEKWGPRHTPAGQPSLTALAPDDIEPLRSSFNAAAGETRVLALLSTT
jgi:hypothetical protein